MYVQLYVRTSTLNHLFFQSASMDQINVKYSYALELFAIEITLATSRKTEVNYPEQPRRRHDGNSEIWLEKSENHKRPAGLNM